MNRLPGLVIGMCSRGSGSRCRELQVNGPWRAPACARLETGSKRAVHAPDSCRAVPAELTERGFVDQISATPRIGRITANVRAQGSLSEAARSPGRVSAIALIDAQMDASAGSAYARAASRASQRLLVRAPV